MNLNELIWNITGGIDEGALECLIRTVRVHLTFFYKLPEASVIINVKG